MTSRETVWVDLGRTGYESAWDLQRQCVRARTSESIPDVVLHTEHDAVLTLGRGSDEANILSADLPRVRVERGGDVTYHGPGQSVLYPIVKLGEAQRDLHQLLRDLEEVVIRALSEFDVAGGRVPEKTGVWIGARKIASIGVAVSRWVTYHGLALNRAMDLSIYNALRPCGLDGQVMTDLRSVLGGRAPGAEAVEGALRGAFQSVFDRSFTRWSPERLARSVSEVGGEGVEARV